MTRRYCRQAVVEELVKNKADLTPTGAKTYDIQTDDWTEWVVVPEDDPRLDTVEIVRTEER